MIDQLTHIAINNDIDNLKKEALSLKTEWVDYALAMDTGKFILLRFVCTGIFWRRRIRHIFIEEITADEYLDLR